jgi:PadR family transcriptional regulator, regulatory protein PadR
MEELGRHGYQLSPGTLYPLLHGLEKKGYLRSSEEGGGRQPRRVYRATPKGRKALAAAKGKVQELFSELLEDSHPHDASGRDGAGAVGLMKELVRQLREDVHNAQEPEAQAMLGTSAAVINGLVKAFDEYERRNVEAKTGSQKQGRR